MRSGGDREEKGSAKMINLYNSGKFELLGTEIVGKKATASQYFFRGMPTICGDGKKVLSIIDGEVIYAGREMNYNTRRAQYKRHVIIRGANGICVTYAYLSDRFVNVGDHVVRGQVIGAEGYKNGIGSVLMLEFRRNGRRVDGYDVLGLHKRGQQSFDFVTFADREKLVCDTCAISGNMRAYINAHPEAGVFWEAISRHLAVAE